MGEKGEEMLEHILNMTGLNKVAGYQRQMIKKINALMWEEDKLESSGRTEQGAAAATRYRVKKKMYVTKTLSSLRRFPHTLSLFPPEGPYSGVAVILDEEIEDQDALCCGLSNQTSIKKLPYPQNKVINISDVSQDDHYYVMMIPVVDQPLSSSQYYVIEARFNRAGQAVTCSRDEDGMEGCCCLLIKDVKPRPFDANNIYQQFRMIQKENSSKLYAESVIYDGRPPRFLRKEYIGSYTTASAPSWNVNLTIAEGQGLNATLRRQLPGFEFPIGLRTPDQVLVGRWYVPFIFVKEHGVKLKQQMRRSTYYKMSLEQRWEQIFEAENVGGDLVAVAVDVTVKSEAVVLGGRFQVGGGWVENGVVWFRNPLETVGGIGLSMGVVERMKWEQARVGWVDVGGGDVRVERVEEHGRGRGWKRFGCYVLVERFVLRRMDGSLLLTHDFYHTEQLKTKWEQI